MTPTLDFTFEQTETTVFGIGRKRGSDRIFEQVPTNKNVQDELRKCASATWKIMQKGEEGSQAYDPSDETASTKYTHISLNDRMAAIFHDLQKADNLTKNPSVLSDMSDAFCYFAQFTDSAHRKLTAVHRTAQFKSLGKSRLMSWIDGTLKLVENPVFKIDAVFDLLIDSKFVHILHPKGFEFVGNLEQFILSSAQEHAEIIQKDLPFVDITPVKQYAATHIRAARCLASIRARSWTKDIDRDALKQACYDTNVKVVESNGQLDVSDDITGFLEVLDRRRYSVGLVMDSPEQFRAASRRRIGSQGSSIDPKSSDP